MKNANVVFAPHPISEKPPPPVTHIIVDLVGLVVVGVPGVVVVAVVLGMVVPGRVAPVARRRRRRHQRAQTEDDLQLDDTDQNHPPDLPDSSRTLLHISVTSPNYVHHPGRRPLL